MSFQLNKLTNMKMLKILKETKLIWRRKERFVSTWSPLAKAFNTKFDKSSYRLSLTNKSCGLFGISELKSADGFEELKQEAMTKTNSLIDEATESSRNRKMVEVFDELSDSLCRVADLAEFIRVAHPDESFSYAAEDACIALSGIVEKLNTHQELYNSLKRIVDNGDTFKTDEIDDFVAKLFLFDFEQCGIHLSEDLRRRVVTLNDHILQTGQRFMAGAVLPREIKSQKLPDNIRQYFARNNDELLMNELYTSPNASIREAAYKIFLQPDEKQEALLKDLLNSRHELAVVCGFPSYAHRAVKGGTVETPEAVLQFLNILSEEIIPRANNDYNEMRRMKMREVNNPDVSLMSWDTSYFTSKSKKALFGACNNEFAPYFSLGSCMDGLNILTQSLYGIKLKSEETNPGEVWAPNIHKLAVICEKEGLLGHIYCDFYDRLGKPNQDCHFTIRGGRLLPDGSYQNPIVVVMLSLPSSDWSNPCLLNPTSVSNLFHEMGHALHSMMGRTKYQHVTGTRCSADFAEVPSILMEYFANDPRVIKLFAKHYQTQQPLSDHMIYKFCALKNIFPSSELQTQVFYSMLDQIYHSTSIEEKSSTTEILAKVQRDYYSLPYVENTAWQLRFSHLVGYGAKYYSYLISRAIASWIWQTYFQDNPLSRTAGDKYRRECLAHGGGKLSSKLVSDFLNKEATPGNFARSLIQEIDAKNDLPSNC